LITHGATISPVAGVNPAQGELVLMKPSGANELALVGRVRVD
jgi:hypothetical protein